MTAKKTLAVPELDKGNHNNKKNLCDFLEQEAIAKKMIEEAHKFYVSFLKSKSVPFSKVFEYPDVKVVEPIFRIYVRDADIADGYIKPELEPDNEVAIDVSFTHNFGIQSFISVYNSMASAWNRAIDLYHDYLTASKSERTKWYKDTFLDKTIVESLYERYYNFIYGHSIRGRESVIENDNKITLQSHKIFTVKIKDFITYTGCTDFFENYWCYGNIGLDSNYYSDETNAKIKIYENEKSNCHSYRYHNSSYPEYPHEVKEPYAIPEIKEYVDNAIAEINDDVKLLYKSLFNNLNNTRGIYDYPYIISKDGIPFEILTYDISKSEVDKKTGLYYVTTKEMEEAHPKYKWPGDAPMLVTKYHQLFIFDIATNDLVDYKLITDTKEVNRKNY